MTLGLLLFGTSGIIIWSLWTRRRTWADPYQVCGTSTVAWGAADILLLSPLSKATVGTFLHELTGRWAVDEYLGHMCGLVGCAAVLHHALIRIELTDQAFLFKFTRNVRHPLRLALPILFALFWTSTTTRQYHLSLFDVRGDYWMRAYWIVLSCVYIYLLGYAARAFLTLRHNVPSRTAALIYLWSSISGIVACITRIKVELFGQSFNGHPITWVSMCGLYGGFALASGYAWRKRARWLELPMDDPVSK
jgi:hypothetical protein